MSLKINNIDLFHPDLRKPKYDRDLLGHDLTSSVDVFTVDSSGCFGLSYFHFEDMEWHHHNELAPSAEEWLWFYPPFEVDGGLALKIRLYYDKLKNER